MTLILQRDTALGLNFAPENFYDGQGFMVSKKMNVKSAKDLDGAYGVRNDRVYHRKKPGGLFPGQ